MFQQLTNKMKKKKQEIVKNFQATTVMNRFNPPLPPTQESSYPRVGGEGRGEGDTQQNFIEGDSAPRFKPLPFYVPFLVEKVPLLHTSHRKWYPFHIPSWGFKIFCPF